MRVSVTTSAPRLMASIPASTAAGCRYCQAHTASSATRNGVEAAKVEAVWAFETDDRFDDAERAALRLGLGPQIVGQLEQGKGEQVDARLRPGTEWFVRDRTGQMGGVIKSQLSNGSMP